jgi:FtsP/CotA-like multicopper oxidase with cupredoxin domain
MIRSRFQLSLSVALLATGCATASNSERRLFSGTSALGQEIQPFPDVAPQTAPTGQELKEPEPFPNSSKVPGVYEVDCTVGQTALQLVNGPKTQMFTYNGKYPGPTIRCKEGTKVIFHVHNKIPLPTNVHFHGMVIPPEQDGAPQNLVPTGASHTYSWVARAGFPMNTWYHAHPHGITHVEVERGLEGFTQILAAKDPLPAAYGNSQIVLFDARFDANNQLPPDTEFDRINGRTGNLNFVNGQLLPKLTLKPGEIRRLTILNGSPARFYDVALPGLKVLYVGTDGGLFEKPVPFDHQLISNGERIQVLIQAPPVPNQTFQLVALPFDRGLKPVQTATIPLMTIKTSAAPVVTPPPVPATLRHVEPIPESGLKRNISMGFNGFGDVKHFEIDKQRFDPLRIDNVANRNQVETWNLVGQNGKWWHPMHLHSTQFQVLEIDGKREPFPAWKDTVALPGSGKVKFVVRYSDFPGLFFFHCHILSHEDDGMMTTLYVNTNENGPRVGDLARLPVESSPELARWAARLAKGDSAGIAEACGDEIDRAVLRGPFGAQAEAVDHPLRWIGQGKVADSQLAVR